MKISRLFYYPVKSLPGVEVNALKLDKFGAVNDRRFMLVNKAGQFITQRQFAELALIDVTAVECGHQILIPDVGDFFLPLAGATDQSMDVAVWGDALEAYLQPQWTERFSEYLGEETFLVYMADNAERLIDSNFCHEERLVSFADGFPLLFCVQASLNFLNEHLHQPITIERFRPNVVVGGAEAFTENNWQQLLIQGNSFDVVKPCARCVIPTINPDDATKQPEVFRVLQRFCKGDGGQVYFGQNVIHQAADAILKIGEIIE